MCGALSEKGDALTELGFARALIAEAVAGLPPSRLALHVCRGNWTRDERAALAGDYRPLLPLLATVGVGTLFLELCTPRAGEIDVLKDLPASCRIGVGVVNQKLEQVETPEEIVAQARRAVELFGPDRVLLTPGLRLRHVRGQSRRLGARRRGQAAGHRPGRRHSLRPCRP